MILISLRTIGALMLVAALAITVPVFAQNIDVGATGSAGGGVDDSVTVDADTSVDASVDTSSSDTRNDDSMTEGSGTVSGQTSTGFNLRRGDTSVINSSGTALSARSVNTENDLEAYAATTLRSNESFEGVEASSDRLVLRFKEDAKLFGFIPHSVTSRVEVSGDGSVKVSRPWYSFLVAGLSSDTSAAIEARVKQAMSEGSASGTMSARSQALVLAEIASALGGSVDTSIDASAAATGSMDMRSSTSDSSEDTGSMNEVQPN